MKKVISYILLIAMIFSLPLNCYAMDEATADDEIEYEGVALLEKLLTKQFDSYKNGRLIDTDALFTPTDSTELYKQYLLWYTGLTAATEEFWTNYEFDLELEKIDGNELTLMPLWYMDEPAVITRVSRSIFLILFLSLKLTVPTTFLKLIRKRQISVISKG